MLIPPNSVATAAMQISSVEFLGISLEGPASENVPEKRDYDGGCDWDGI
jgi:hypothetical protein